jgi:hypothetical protein
MKEGEKSPLTKVTMEVDMLNGVGLVKLRVNVAVAGESSCFGGILE